MSESIESGYRLVEHTADAGLIAWAPNPEGAFAQAALGMFAVVLGQDTADWRGTGIPQTLEVVAEGYTWDDLLVNWLAELVYHFDVDGFVPQKIAFSECAPPKCVAHLEGLRLNDPDEAGGVGIKAITYHQLQVHV